jgi:hypothetical protein
MLDFNEYMMRHGESWVQDIIERLERAEDVRHNTYLSLEQRWHALMQDYKNKAA